MPNGRAPIWHIRVVPKYRPLNLFGVIDVYYPFYQISYLEMNFAVQADKLLLIGLYDMIGNLIFVCLVVLCQVFSLLYLLFLNELIIIINNERRLYQALTCLS